MDQIQRRLAGCLPAQRVQMRRRDAEAAGIFGNGMVAGIFGLDHRAERGLQRVTPNRANRSPHEHPACDSISRDITPPA